jgi:hypothetical protein
VLEPEPVIVCVDCGGRAHLLTPPRAEPPAWEPGDIVAYRCEDCLDRWDLVLPDEDDLDA